VAISAARKEGFEQLLLTAEQMLFPVPQASPALPAAG
jgi:hypothetical protein